LHQRNQEGRLVNLTVFALQKNCTLIYADYPCSQHPQPQGSRSRKSNQVTVQFKNPKSVWLSKSVLLPPQPFWLWGREKKTPDKTPMQQTAVLVSSPVGMGCFSPNQTPWESKPFQRAPSHKRLWKFAAKWLRQFGGGRGRVREDFYTLAFCFIPSFACALGSARHCEVVL